MEVVFLDNRTLEILDYGFVDDGFNIILDNVVPQSSTFTVNKESVNASIGNYLYVKDNRINYIGIITSIEKKENVSEVKTTDFISILNLKIKLTSYSGNLSVYLLNIIKNAFINNIDPMQNLPYLTISRDDDIINGALTFESDTIDSIASVISTLNKVYSLGVYYRIIYDYGKIKGIDLHISKCKRGLVLRSDLSIISNLSISDNNTQTINKITFYPKDENASYKNAISFYLLTDGTITQDSSHKKRYKNVSVLAKTFADKDYASLSTTAQNEMLSSSLEHSITFDYLFENKIAVLFEDIKVGDFIEFITPNKTYETMITKVSLKGNLYSANITLGEYRLNLTEKIKLLSKK